MRGKGIHYDTGTHLSDGWTREAFDSSTVRREMQVIAGDLHCTAVRITGSDPDRLTEFGCCTYRGAADRGGRGFLIIDRDHEPDMSWEPKASFHALATEYGKGAR